MTSTNNPRSVGQEFVSATVHLAGAVEIETGHVAHYSAEHIQARIGGVLIYFLDFAAVAAFAEAVADTAETARATFDHAHAAALPPQLRHHGQDVSLIVRLRGRQAGEKAQGKTAAASYDGVPFVGCRIGGIRLVVRDAEAMRLLAHVADTVARIAGALWPDRHPVPEPSPEEAETAVIRG
ncbi:hypothetical protein G3R41_21460 [Modestobacter muralis]|uniref:Uncharacterized protein n=1 Tax=Modestobacter muralis TaxID=1608614 RepID=A0A6P0HFX9_9ACTN|nr:hypothetical protein [Modestobacter muralis]NEN53474.1 hypothetical protein [Modestobacter muralis]